MNNNKKKKRHCSTQIPKVNQNKETLSDRIFIYRMHRNFFMVNKHSLYNHRSYKASGVAGAGRLDVESEPALVWRTTTVGTTLPSAHLQSSAVATFSRSSGGGSISMLRSLSTLIDESDSDPNLSIGSPIENENESKRQRKRCELSFRVQ